MCHRLFKFIRFKSCTCYISYYLVGSPKLLPWLEDVSAALLVHFGGEEMHNMLN